MIILYDEFINNIETFLSLNFFFYLRMTFFLIISVINIITDIRQKKVFPFLLIIFSVLFVISWFFIKPPAVINVLIGIFIIIIIYLSIYFLTKGKTGLGDMIYFVFFSSMFGCFFSLIAFVLSYWIASAVLIIPLLLKKINMKSRIPFIPFLFSGCAIVLIYSLWFYY